MHGARVWSYAGHIMNYGDNNLTPTIIRKRLLRRRLLTGPALIRSKAAKNGCYWRQSSLTYYAQPALYPKPK
jgi:hypothetical protein